MRTDITKIQRIRRNYYEKLCANELDNLEEMGQFLEAYSFPKLNRGERKPEQTKYK